MFNRKRFSNANRDPRLIYAQFDCVCAETGHKIPKGTECVYYPTSKQVFEMGSRQACEFVSWKSDLAMGWDY